MNQSPSAVLAIDFSADRLDVALHTTDGSWPIPHHAFDNSWAGFQALKQDLVHHLDAQAVDSLTAVGESTGLYWWHAFYHIANDPDLEVYQPQLALLNPMHVKHFRKALPQRDKDDHADTHLIARYYQVNGVKQFYQFDSRYLPLRQLTRAYSRLTHSLAAEKAFARTMIYLLASDYQNGRVFSDTFGVTSQHVLSEFDDIAAVAAIPVDELAAALNQVARGKLPDADKTARTLRLAADHSYPLDSALRPAVHNTLTLTLDHIRFLESQKLAWRQLIETELAHLPEAELALAEPGLGTILVAGLLSEIQDTRRFLSGQKYDRQRKCLRPRRYRDGQAAVARLAGLWWPRNSSGRFEGQDRHLAQERNPYLRYWLVQTAFSLKGHQTEYADYYRRKYQEVTKHQHKRALILTARKATRMIFALLHKGQTRRLEEEAAA